MIKIQVQLRSVYGRELIYPVNEMALKFTKLLGRKTLTKSDIAHIKALGFEIEWISQF